jgi:hypothetical protein
VPGAVSSPTQQQRHRPLPSLCFFQVPASNRALGLLSLTVPADPAGFYLMRWNQEHFSQIVFVPEGHFPSHKSHPKREGAPSAAPSVGLFGLRPLFAELVSKEYVLYQYLAVACPRQGGRAVARVFGERNCSSSCPKAPVVEQHLGYYCHMTIISNRVLPLICGD